jgi:hypothetical protein
MAIVHGAWCVPVLVLGGGPKVRLLGDGLSQLVLATVTVHCLVLDNSRLSLCGQSAISVTMTTIVALTLPPTLGSSLGLAVLTKSYSMPLH